MTRTGKKLFAVASVSALGGVVVAAVSTGCTSTDVIVTPPPRSDAQTPSRPTPEAGDVPSPRDEGEPFPCHNTPGPFTPSTFNAAFPQSRTACTAEQVTALADACQLGVKDPNTEAACIEARALVANKSCVDCIFGAKGDPLDHVITLLPNEKPSARINQTACVDHATSISGCGAAFVNGSDCLDEYCKTTADGGKCSEDTGETIAECTKRVFENECKPYQVAPACFDGVKANESTCLLSEQSAKGFRTLFINFSTVACAAASIVSE